MYLRTLKLENFRSFRKATVEFKPGTMAIVGHNGAGKSNLLVAIDFVLSNKQTLRSRREMEVYIYSRMINNRQDFANFAKVELIFEGADLVEHCKDGTLKISRRIDVEGLGDEIRVNGKKLARAKAHSILQGLGFNTQNLCNYIRVAQLDELLDSNGFKRKQMIEQVAGITSLNSQKYNEAQKLLETVTENLLNIDGKIGDFDKTVGATTNRFEELIENMRFKDEYLKREVALLVRKRTDCLVRSSQFLKTKQLIERTLHEAEENIEYVHKKQAEVLARISELEQISDSSESNKKKIALLESVFVEHKNQLEVLKAALVKDELFRRELEAKIITVDREIHEKSALLGKVADKEDKKRIAFEELSASVTCLKNKGYYEQVTLGMEAELRSQERAIEEHQKQIKKLETETKNIEKSRGELLQKTWSALLSANRAKALVEESARKALTEEEAELEGAELVEEKKKLLKTTMSELFARTPMNIRIGSLCFEKLMDKLNADPERFRTIINGFHGRLIDLIGVEDTHKPAVEAVAGDLLFAIVVDSHKTASAIMELFSRSNYPGSLKFLTLEKCGEPDENQISSSSLTISQNSLFKRSQSTDVNRAKAVKTNAGIHDVTMESIIEGHDESAFYHSVESEEAITQLIDVISFNTRFEAPVKSVFDKWILVKDLESGLHMARNGGSAVTPSGQWILPRGIVRAGLSTSSGAFELKAKIQEIRSEFQVANVELAQAEKRRENARKALDQNTRAMAEENRTADALKNDIHQVELHRSTVARECEMLGAELSVKQQEVEELKKSIAVRQQVQGKALRSLRNTNYDKLRARVKTAEDEFNALKSESSSLKHYIAQLQAKGRQFLEELDGFSRMPANKLTAEVERKCVELQEELARETEKLKGARVNGYVQKQLAIARNLADDLAKTLIDSEANLDQIQHLRAENKAKGRQVVEELKAVQGNLAVLAGQTEYEGEFDGVPVEELKAARNEWKARMGDLADSDVLFCNEDEILKELQAKLEAITFVDDEVTKYAKCVGVVKELEDDIAKKQSESFKEIFSRVSSAFCKFFAALGPSGSQARLVLKKAKPRSSTHGSQDLDTVEIWVDFNDGVEPDSGFWHRSRGQRSVIAMSFLLALLSYDASTIYCFDEIDSAMDESKRTCLSEFFKQIRVDRGVQMFFCTHRPEMLAHADTIYLVTNDGVQSYVEESSLGAASDYVRMR